MTVFPGRRVKVAAACAATLVLLAHAAPAAAAQTERNPRFAHGLEAGGEPWYLPSGTTPAETAALKTRWEALDAEIRAGAGASAGTYTQLGAMRSGFLRWAPGGGYVYLYVYEVFAVIHFSYGSVRVTPAGVVFEREGERRSASGECSGPLDPRWVPVRWKGADYLVPDRRMRDFGHYVAGLDQYNDFNGPCCEFAPFFSRHDDGARGPVGRDEVPVVPREWTGYMRRPIEATISSVGRTRKVKEYGLEGELYGHAFEDVTLTPVRLDVGRAPGMRPGLLFRMVGAPEGQYLKVTRVGRRHSNGVVIRDLGDDGKESCFAAADSIARVTCPPVVAGARVTTSPR